MGAAMNPAEGERRFRIATSGWYYRHWEGRFYPEGLPSGEWLAYYTKHFSTVEVNASFYRLRFKGLIIHYPPLRIVVKGRP
ncbi:MAG: DUF72 domain-containing protein [bacterium]